MSSHSLLTDLTAVRTNQSGQITQHQRDSLRDLLGTVPSWFTLGLMILLFAGVVAVGGSFLSRSTPLAILAALGIIMVVFAITSAIGGIIGRGRAAGFSAQPVNGSVIWRGNQYVAQTAEGRVLQPVTQGLDHLQPGDYTFYVVRGKNILLSAEPAAASRPSLPADADALRAIVERNLDFDPSASPEQLGPRLAELRGAVEQLEALGPGSIDQETVRELARRASSQIGLLMRAQGVKGIANLAQEVDYASRTPLDPHGVSELTSALIHAGALDPSSLEANRQGAMTGRQRGRLLRGLRSHLLVAAVILGFLLLAASSLISNGRLDQLALAVAAAAVLELILLLRVGKDLADALSGSVQAVEGIASKYSRSTGRSRGATYYYRINQLSLEVSRLSYDALLEGIKYRAYYAPRTRRLLNVEPVSA